LLEFRYFQSKRISFTQNVPTITQYFLSFSDTSILSRKTIVNNWLLQNRQWPKHWPWQHCKVVLLDGQRKAGMFSDPTLNSIRFWKEFQWAELFFVSLSGINLVYLNVWKFYCFCSKWNLNSFPANISLTLLDNRLQSKLKDNW